MQIADGLEHLAPRRYHTVSHWRSRRPRLCPAAPAGFTSYGTMKKKWVNDEIHVLSGYLAQIHVLNRN